MAIIKPFKAIRPNEEVVSKVAALPYDVYNREEALEEVKKEPLSFLKIDRAEVQFDNTVGTYDDKVYDRARDTLYSMIEDKTFIQDDKPCYYIYSLTMEGREQTGIVACASIDDYQNNVIKKHENTRADKEEDRINHVDRTNANTGPIFLAYRSQEKLNRIINTVKKEKPLYDFASPDGIKHTVWKVEDTATVALIESTFNEIDSIYIADGHHRAASAVKVGLKRRKDNPNYDKTEEFNFFLCVLFGSEELMIMPYNRVVKDLNGYTKEQFIDKVSNSFEVELVGTTAFAPEEKATFGMYLDKEWYKLTAKPEIIVDDAVDGLDVSILQTNLLTPILGINDPRVDKRIDFVGGIRGLKELERRANADMLLAFSMYPTSINELFEVSDANALMPPKSTWFEPKLRSGIFIHKLS